MLEERKTFSEGAIRGMFETFYARVREDAFLAPAFQAGSAGSRPEHLDRRVDFWSTVLLASGRNKSDPQARRLRLVLERPAPCDATARQTVLSTTRTTR